MLDSLQSRIGIAAIAIIAAVVVMIAVFSNFGGMSTPSNASDGENSKRIIAYTVSYNRTSEIYVPVYDFTYVKVDNMQINTAMRFLNPFGKTLPAHFSQQSMMAGSAITDPDLSMTSEQKTALIEGADAFEQYVLIRLPEFIVGPADDVSAFRAYSALDPESKCLLGYRRDTATLQDPCHSDIFRASDGYSCFGKIAIGSNPVVSSYNALPRMELSVDDHGYLIAIKPDGQPHGDGTVGEGRMLSIGEIQLGDDKDPSCEPYAR